MNFDLIDTNLFFILLGVIVAIPGIGLAIFGIFTWLKRANKISIRLDQFVATEFQEASISTASQIIPREISGSLFSRTIISWFNKFLYFMGRFTPERMAIDMEHKLTIARNPANLHAGKFFAIRFLVFLAGIIFAFLANRDFKNINTSSVVIGFLAVGMCLVLPVVWLNGRVQSRQNEIQRGLPDALDMLSVCASAGLAFDQSMQKISNLWDTELGLEFKRVTQEMEMGVSRTIALKNMSNRLDVNDLSQFISIIIQAEKIGMSYSDVLHNQALQLRVLRQLRAREIANQLPGKIIIPVILFIFPALLAVILGPAIPIIMNVF
ncbi:MAG: type II secretion system F family protein [Pelolinea sp.]|nr:type II secretion system F family protein [Pelolinea sp.]